MRWRLSHAAEVVGRGGEPAAEVILPDPVDDAPPGERVSGVDDPFRQCDAALSLTGVRKQFERGRRAWHSADRAGHHLLLRLGDVAAIENEDRPRFAAVRAGTAECTGAVMHRAGVNVTGRLPGEVRGYGLERDPDDGSFQAQSLSQFLLVGQ